MPEDLAIYFKGAWQFEREIIFSTSGLPYATARGEAVFTASPGEENALHYKEQGKVTLTNDIRATAFYRSYLYAFNADGLDVFFQDELTQNFSIYQSYILERPHQRLVAKEQHLCNKDIYEGNYLFKDAFSFLHTTLINGPQKDFFITTHFNKHKS